MAKPGGEAGREGVVVTLEPAGRAARSRSTNSSGSTEKHFDK